MKAALAALLVGLLLLPLAAIPASAADLPDRAIPVVETQDDYPRFRYFEDGKFIRVRIGDIALGVAWTENASLGHAPSMFLDYRRFFGGAELYDEQGNYLRTIPLPLSTVLRQSFGRMFEFRDLDGDGLFDLRENRTDPGDQPVKFLSLGTAWYLDGAIEEVVTNTSAWVNFTLSADGVRYHSIYDEGLRMWRPATEADGVLDKISFAFHLAATAEDVTLEVPIYKITLANGNEFEPTKSEFLENRTVSGTSVNVDGKYDQRIEGWDFGYADSKLALGTEFGFGNRYSKPIVQWLQRQFGGACLKDGSFEHCESESGPATPVRIERDRLRIFEDWHPAGEMYWTSGVTVDGVPGTMTFEIYHAESGAVNRGDTLFSGFHAFGAFVYPQGNVIVHDPGISAASVLAPIPEATNLAPSVLVGLQLAVVGLALVPAVLLRMRARKGRP